MNLYQKYIITKTDGTATAPNAQYFVLRLDTDKAARTAMRTYIMAIEDDEPDFARQLWDWLHDLENKKQGVRQ